MQHQDKRTSEVAPMPCLCCMLCFENNENRPATVAAAWPELESESQHDCDVLMRLKKKCEEYKQNIYHMNKSQFILTFSIVSSCLISFGIHYIILGSLEISGININIVWWVQGRYIILCSLHLECYQIFKIYNDL